MNVQDLREVFDDQTAVSPSYRALPIQQQYIYSTQTGGFAIESRQDGKRLVTVMMILVSGEPPIVRWTEGVVSE